MLPRRSSTAIVTVSAICCDRDLLVLASFLKCQTRQVALLRACPQMYIFVKPWRRFSFFLNVTSKTICGSLVISSCCLKCALSFLFSSYWLWCFCTVRVVLAAQKTLCLINCINTCSRLSNARVVTGVRFPVVSLQVGEKLGVLQPKPWIFTLIKSVTF